MEYTIHGWPQYREDVQLAARDFIIRGKLRLHDGLLVRGDRIVVPFSLRKQILERIHEGHMGVAKYRECAAQSVWWPRIGKDIKSWVASCRHCLEKQPSQASEPLLPSALPDRPFQKVGIDICEFRNKHYLVQVDYYSRYIDVTYLPSWTSAMVTRKLKNFFPHHGVPQLSQTTAPSPGDPVLIKTDGEKGWKGCMLSRQPPSLAVGSSLLSRPRRRWEPYPTVSSDQQPGVYLAWQPGTPVTGRPPSPPLSPGNTSFSSTQPTYKSTPVPAQSSASTATPVRTKYGHMMNKPARYR